MKTFLLCMLGLSIAACSPQKGANDHGNELAMLVGTYTNGSSRGIYTFGFDQETGLATALDSTALPNPSFLIASADGTRVYAVSEMNDSTAALSALAFDRQTGALRLLNTQLTGGADPCHVSTNGQVVLTANYSGGSLTVFPLNPADGSLMPAAIRYNGAIGGPDTVRQCTPHVHCTLFTPDGKYLLATDFSADRLLRFKLQEGEPLPQADGVAADIEADSGPRHITFSPDGHFAYLISELSGKVTAFSYNDGNLTQIQSIAADHASARGSADIHLSPDGRFLYASNRLKEDGIAIFAVNADNGLLTPAGYQKTGVHPRNFHITPNGKYLLVACRDSNVIQVYKRNLDNGLLTDTRQDIRVDKPVCIQFVE